MMRRCLTRASFAQVAVTAFLVWLACAPAPTERALPPPLLKAVDYSDHEAFIHAQPGTQISALVDLSMFDGLRPGLKVEEASELLGEPTNEYTERRGRDHVYVFSSSSRGSVEVVRQPVDSEGYTGERWFLRCSLSGADAARVVQPMVLAAMPNHDGDFSLSVLADDGQVGLDFKGERLIRIWWLRAGPLKLPPRYESTRHR